MTAPFKQGDRVRLKPKEDRPKKLALMSAEPGAEATVRAFNANTAYLYITWDEEDPRVHGQSDGGYYPESFELVEPAEEGA